MRKRAIAWCVGILVGLCVIGFAGVAIAHAVVFSRADYGGYDDSRYLLYADVDAARYPREAMSVLSGENRLAAYLYGADNTLGLIVLSVGHRDASDVKLSEITYFVDAGWQVLCYDYTGCYDSEGSGMVGYAQAARDLDAVLTHVEGDPRFADLPIALFGHSLGAYATAAALQFGHDVQAAVVTSGFDTPREQWAYSIERFTGVLHVPLSPFTALFTAMAYGEDADLSAIDGINAVDIPVLVVSGTGDAYYGGMSPLYEKRALIRNPNCTMMLMDDPARHGHFDYYLTREALAYRATEPSGAVDKELYMQHDLEFMETLNEFLLTAVGE